MITKWIVMHEEILNHDVLLVNGQYVSSYSNITMETCNYTNISSQFDILTTLIALLMQSHTKSGIKWAASMLNLVDKQLMLRNML